MRRAARARSLPFPIPILFAVAIVLASGCASAPAPAPPAAVPSHAATPRPGGALADLEAALRAAHGPDVSGFMLLQHNGDALAWRLALVDAARHSLDLQYYVWFGDRSGRILLARVVAAADRGVKVRLLVDDLNTMLRDMTTVELRDALHVALDAHPNIELRVFNGWRGRGLLERVAEGASEFTRLNRRMHNKQMIADNRAAIVGGRNIGDEYFGLNPAFNFHDLDVLAAGPVAREASAVFDRYWNSGWAGRGPRPEDAKSGAAEPVGPRSLAIAGLDAGGRTHDTPTARAAGEPRIPALAATMHPGLGRVRADPPSRDARSSNRVPEAFRALMRSARREVLIVNAYVIPDTAFMADLRELAARGVSIRLLTNSLSSHDVPAVNSHYEGFRPAILATGAQLHELRADPAIQATLVDTPPVASRFTGLHVKAMVVDRERAFVGSMNLDPRSEIFNSEMGVVVDSPPLARELAAARERVMSGANSWQVSARADGTLRWRSDAGELARQPARSAWQRVENLFFKLFPPTLY
ncbi:MAG TPA: phospholipase D family protein [Burkholderiaceae bacterium]|nr:phospholipase D family protein [Burkholderiaceae bacterium]